MKNCNESTKSFSRLLSNEWSCTSAKSRSTHWLISSFKGILSHRVSDKMNELLTITEKYPPLFFSYIGLMVIFKKHKLCRIHGNMKFEALFHNLSDTNSASESRAICACMPRRGSVPVHIVTAEVPICKTLHNRKPRVTFS